MKNPSKFLLFCALTACSFGLTGCFQQSTQKTENISTPQEEKPTQQLPVINPTKTEEKTQTVSGYTGTLLAGKTVPYLSFTKEDYAKAKKENKNIILYFYANWCPICKEEVPEIYAAFNQFTIANTIGFRVNYNDSETDEDEKALAKEFGIAYQHSKVFIKNGQRVLKSPESWDLKRYLQEVSNTFEPKVPEIPISSTTIEMTDAGFVPATISLKKGTTVTFVNKASREIWPASAVHPTHNTYPEKGGCLGSAFDACKGLKVGESWSFTFTQVGTWSYHDHLRASNTGTITISE